MMLLDALHAYLELANADWARTDGRRIMEAWELFSRERAEESTAKELRPTIANE